MAKVIADIKPSIFSSEQIRSINGETRTLLNQTKQGLVNSGLVHSSSFRFDAPGSGFRSTQQIPVDYSKFENHTFFNSAQVNVNTAFDKIINRYPFDGTKKEYEEYVDSLTGFEKYILDNFPRNTGYLFFSGANQAGTSGGSYITVKDFAGSEFPSVSKDQTGQSILNPGFKSISFETKIFVPDQSNDNQIILQKLKDTSNGISLALSQSSSTTSCDLLFAIISGSSNLNVSTSIKKGQWNHICATFNRKPGINKLEIYNDTKLVVTSSSTFDMGEIDFKVTPFNIGSGSIHGTIFTPKETLSGALDEFRVFHDVRTSNQQKAFANKNIFASPELKLYFKFNEPTGSLGTKDSVVLDSSGNSLHSYITNFGYDLRNTGSISTSITNEKTIFNPVLFPGYSNVVLLNTDLLSSASNYDDINPNLITKLIPPHYLEEGKEYFGFDNNDGEIVEQYGGDTIPGEGKLGSAQIMSSLLYIWGKFFDEMKISLDHFSKLTVVGYDRNDTIADQFLPFLSEYYGIKVPNLFANSSPEQFFDGENVSSDPSTDEYSLQYVRNEITRRILTNLSDVIKSKGTIHSIKSLIRSVGIDPDSNFKIREYGGPTKRSLGQSRLKKTQTSTMLTFSGSSAPNIDKTDVNAVGINPNLPFIQAAFLSGSRLEKGFPEPSSTFSPLNDSFHGISTRSSDGLFTSGSWTYEGIYKFDQNVSHTSNQSLTRLSTTGSINDDNKHGLLFNLTSTNTSVKLWGRPSSANSTPTNYAPLEMEITGVNIMDGNQWNVSFGRQRNDEIKSEVSSSYFLRVARQLNGNIFKSNLTSSYYLEDPTGDFSNVVLQTNVNNPSGCFFLIGSQSLDPDADRYLHHPSINNVARYTNFSGKVSQIRFWSKALKESEWKEHVRNYKSLGTKDPLTNFNFINTPSGSFEKLRVDLSTDQQILKADGSKNIEIFDFSQNLLHATGTGFEANKEVVKPETFYYSHISPKFDEASTDNKVRAKSFQESENAEEYNAEIAPIYKLDPSEEATDDLRFTIDFSIADALNEDIIAIFSTLDSIENAIGDPELVFSPDYPSLAVMREMYFNRLERKINNKEFFEFYKWFDESIGSIIEQLLPNKTKFEGINFVIESHILERAKLEYQYNDIYLGENDRHGLKGTILLQQFMSPLRKF